LQNPKGVNKIDILLKDLVQVNDINFSFGLTFNEQDQ